MAEGCGFAFWGKWRQMATITATPNTNLNQMIAGMKSGDTLKMEPGVYRQRIWCAIYGITIEATGAIIDGAGIAGMQPWDELVSIRASNVTIQGLTVPNSVGEGFGIGDAAMAQFTGCKLLGVTIDNTQYNAVTVERHNGGVFEVTITNSAMSNHPSKRPVPDWPGGFAIVKGSSGNVIRKSRISKVWGEPIGIFWNSNDNIVEDCEISEHWAPIVVDVAARNIFRRNFLYNISMFDTSQQNRGIVFSNEHGTLAMAATAAGGSSNENQAENNFLFGYAIAFGFDKQTKNPKFPTGNVVQFNTVVSGDIGRWSGGAQIVRNNILYNCFVLPEFTSITVRDNLIYPQAGNVGTGAIIADPEFVNPSGTSLAGWQISPTSPAVGKATESIPQTDYFGNPRPTPASLGAHEPTVVIEPEAKGWRIPYMVEGDDTTYYLPPPSDVGQTLVSTESGEFEWVQR
jgi:hypothetical protein